jgi:hypothetical protein
MYNQWDKLEVFLAQPIVFVFIFIWIVCGWVATQTGNAKVMYFAFIMTGLMFVYKLLPL